MFVRLGTDYEIRNGGYFETIENGADQSISNPSKIAPIGFGVVAFKWLELWRPYLEQRLGQIVGGRGFCTLVYSKNTLEPM